MFFRSKKATCLDPMRLEAKEKTRIKLDMCKSKSVCVYINIYIYKITSNDLNTTDKPIAVGSMKLQH